MNVLSSTLTPVFNSHSSMNAFAYPNGYSTITFTEPSRGHYSDSWAQSSEGIQHFVGQISHPDSPGYHGFHSRSQVLDDGAILGDSLYTMSNHRGENTSTPNETWISRSSGATDSPHLTSMTTISDQQDPPESVELHPSLSQMSWPVSIGHSDVTSSSGDTALYASSPQYSESQVYSEYNYQDGEDTISRHGSIQVGPSHGLTRRLSHVIPVTSDSGSVFPSPAEDIMFPSPLDMTTQSMLASGILTSQEFPNMDKIQAYNLSYTYPSTDYSESRISSPRFAAEDTYTVGPSMISESAADHHTPTYNTQSSRPRRKTASRQNSRTTRESSNYVQSDLDLLGPYDGPSERGRGRRGSGEHGENSARDHPLYQKATPGPDGLYHCPWEGTDPSCNHKPEKLKCNYDKFVDSHLKPYRCKVPTCENAKFSSTACLLRHEREAHAMHGHGEKPFLCTADRCDRGIVGNGFPRHWNLRDHMKRVHNCSPEPLDNEQPVRGNKKRKKSDVGDAHSKKKNPLASQNNDKALPSVTLEEQFHQQRLQLINSMQHLDDPNDPAARKKLYESFNLLKDMASTSHRMNTPKVRRTSSQQSG